MDETLKNNFHITNYQFIALLLLMKQKKLIPLENGSIN